MKTDFELTRFLIRDIDFHRLPLSVLDFYLRLLDNNEKLLLVGASTTFGYFILSQIGRNLHVRWTERNFGLIGDFETILSNESPIILKESRVSKHDKKVNGNLYEFPRIYLDGKDLDEAGYHIATHFNWEINKVTQQITLWPINDESEEEISRKERIIQRINARKLK